MFKKKRTDYNIDLNEIVQKASLMFSDGESRFPLEEPYTNILKAISIPYKEMYVQDRDWVECDEYYEEIEALEKVLRDEDYPIPDQLISFSLTDWQKGYTIEMCRKRMKEKYIENHSRKTLVVQEVDENNFLKFNKAHNRRIIAEWLWGYYGIRWRCKDNQLYYIDSGMTKYSLEEFVHLQAVHDHYQINELNSLKAKFKFQQWVAIISLFVISFLLITLHLPAYILFIVEGAIVFLIAFVMSR